MIGMILKNMRLTAGLSQKELGKILNLADTTISSYERENSNPDFETIIKIADTCGYKLVLKDKKGNVHTLKDMSKEKDF